MPQLVNSSPLTFLSTPKGSLTIAKSISRPLHLSLVIPTYQERENIIQIIQQLVGLLEPEFAGQYELIVVDDNSPDRTAELALNLRSDYPQLQVIRRQSERGLATAVIRGWQAGRGDVLAVIDADLQHPPEVLLQQLKAIASGADLVVASRHVEGGGVSDWNIGRRILSRGAQLLGLLVLPGVISRVSDPLSGYFMVRRDAIAGQKLNPVGYKILIEVLARGTFDTITEVSYIFQERQDGQSKVTYKQYLEYIQHLITLWWERLWSH
ncbi:MAG: polyprenol monophosphomannose synthase [Spirulina sp. SIO3F2]|nr:polyprenol monophosphomannose synthase [Spirulina sp. SIO3F2]